MPPILIAALAIIGFALLFWIGIHLLAKLPTSGPSPLDLIEERSATLLGWALSQGYDFDRSRQEDLTGRSGFQILRPDKALYALNTISGKHGGHRFECFEHHYNTQVRDRDDELQTVVTSFTAVAFEAPFPLPSVRVTATASDSDNDIDLESAEFNEAYEVQSDDRRAAFDLLQPRAMALLMEKFPMSLESNGGTIVFTSGRELSVTRIADLLATGARFIELIPPHLETA
jgi:hypothetical protein